MFIIFLLLFSFSANAKTVEATGYGKDKKIALEDAKTKAVEMVAGSWVDSSKKSVNGSMQQEIKQFTTGVVENYKVINENETSITIEANVIARRDNSIDSSSFKTNPSQLVDSFQNIENEKKSGMALDSLYKAIEFKVKSIKPLRKEDNLFYISVIGKYSYSKKWLNDYEEFSRLNTNYQFKVLDCKRIIAIAEFDIGDKKEFVASYQSVNVERAYLSKNEDNLWIGYSETIETFYALPNIENIKSVKVNFVCENEDLKLLLKK